jgi:hypothetical protein
MKEKVRVLSLSAGKFKDDSTGEQRVFASLNYLDKSVSDIIEDDQIKVGQQHVKIKICPDDNNALARKIAQTFTFPCDVVLDLDLAVVKNTPSLSVVGFDMPTSKV